MTRATEASGEWAGAGAWGLVAQFPAPLGYVRCTPALGARDRGYGGRGSEVVDGWLHGRAHDLRGGLAMLFYVDEHMGGFGGARACLADLEAARPAG